MKNIFIDNNLKDKANIALGCLEYKVNVSKDNQELWDFIDAEIIPFVQKTYTIDNLPKQKNIAGARETYKKLGKEPSRYRVSSEALIRRILKGQGLYKINNVVDINNLISIKTGYSVGSYDLSKLKGDLTFRIGNANEKYQGIGKDIINIENIPVFADVLGPYGSPTSDSVRAMIKDTTKNVLTVLISFTGKEGLEENLFKARTYLEEFSDAEDIEISIFE